MPTAKGTYQRIVLIEESVWGTTPASPSGYVIPINSYSGDVMRQNLIENPEIRGNRNAAAPVLGNVSVAFGLDCPLHLDAVGWLLKHCIGVPVTTGSSPYTHISKSGFSGASAGDLPAGLSMEIGFTDINQYLQMTGCKIDGMNVSVSPEGVSAFTFNFVGQDFARGTSTLASGGLTTYTSSALSEFAGTIQEGGASIAYVTACDFNFSNTHDTSLYTVGGAGTLGELPEGPVMLSGSVTALFQDGTLLDKAINNTESSLQLAWTSGSHSLTFNIDEIVYEPAAPTASGDRGVLITLPFRAYYQNDVDACVLRSTLVNDVSSY
jgi:hypothetical protein